MHGPTLSSASTIIMLCVAIFLIFSGSVCIGHINSGCAIRSDQIRSDQMAASYLGLGGEQKKQLKDVLRGLVQ